MQVGVEGVGDAKKSVDPRRPPAALEASDRRLGRAYERGEIGLGKAALLPPIRDLPGDLREQPALLGAGEPRTNPLHGLTHISIMLYIAVVRYERSIAVAAYYALMLVWLFWVVDRQVFFGEPVRDTLAAASVLVVQVLAGLAVARWWALLLPVPVVLIAIPLGYPSTNLGEPLPVWFGLLVFSPVALAAIAGGIGGRKIWQRRNEPEVA